jgi:hypothetical protein
MRNSACEKGLYTPKCQRQPIGLKLPSAKVTAAKCQLRIRQGRQDLPRPCGGTERESALGRRNHGHGAGTRRRNRQEGHPRRQHQAHLLYGDEEAPKEDLKALTKAGDLSKLLPGFNPDLLKSVGGIDTFVMDLTTTNLSYDFNQGEDGKEGEVKKPSKDAEKKSETSLAIRKLKAHAFGFDIMGKYEEGVFDGSFHSEDFGGGKFNINASDPEKWVGRAADVDLKFGGRKLFGPVWHGKRAAA